MAVDNFTDGKLISVSHTVRLYGGLSWLFLVSCILVSTAFLISHSVIHGVKINLITIEQLESLLFPGVYWTLAASCITLLALSALLLGLTLAITVVRACLHNAACRLYWAALAIQVVPWIYFFASTAT